MKTNKTIYKSSITGRFVSKKFAEENPDTTYKTIVAYTLKKDKPQPKKKKNYINFLITFSIITGFSSLFWVSFEPFIFFEFFVIQIGVAVVLIIIAIIKITKHG